MRYAPKGNALEVQGKPALKKNSSVQQSPKRAKVLARGLITMGVDLGDKTSRYCVLDEDGQVQAEGSVATTKPLP